MKTPRPSKKHCFEKHAKLIAALNAQEQALEATRALLRENASDYFGFEVGDSVVWVGSPVGNLSGVIKEIRFHHPYPNITRKTRTIGAFVVRPWKRGPKHELCTTDRNDVIVTDRDAMKLVRKNVPEGQRFKRCRP